MRQLKSEFFHNRLEKCMVLLLINRFSLYTNRDRDIDLASLKSSESSSSPRSRGEERLKGENLKQVKPEERLKGPLRAAYEGKLNLLVSKQYNILCDS